jgi:multidrug efflux pump subunit AcrA (membrane-fusion protein)
VPAPVRARRVAVALSAAFVAFVFFALLAPWRQNIQGGGRVIAYAPLERQQTVEAPVSGRVVRWYVSEGSEVAEGDRIVEISDNDPRLLERLETQRRAVRERLTSYEERVEAALARLAAVQQAQRESVRAAEARVNVAEQSVESAAQSAQAAAAAVETARINLRRQRALADDGLASLRELELAILAARRTETELESAEATVTAARSELSSKEAELSQARADLESNVADARASLQSARTDVAETRRALADVEVRISRQLAQLVTAPRAGTIFRLVANQGGEQVSAGDTLAILVPNAAVRAVELWVDGNDAAIVEPGRPVRLQFEGWPAVQFSGWPSVAVGTFGGRVAFVDATDDGRGDFRMVVTPDPDDEPWPSPRFLRQGARANGWVLLERVSIGYELWRRLNGFPPSLRRPPTTGDPDAAPPPAGISVFGGGGGGPASKAMGGDR